MVERFVLKRNLIFSLLLISGAGSSIFGQSKIDSLESKLKGKLNDSLRVRTYIRLSNEYSNVNIKNAIEAAEQAVQLSEAKNLLWGKGYSYFYLASLYQASGDFSTSTKYNNLALNIAFQRKDSLSLASCYNNLGLNYYSFGKYDEAYFYYTQSYQLARLLKKDSLGMAIALHNIATVFKELGQYDRALDYLKLSQTISTAIKDRESKAYNYDEIGDIFRKKKLYDSALHALKYSIHVARELKMNVIDLESRTLNNVARTYLDIGDNAKALHYYDTVHAIFEKTEDEFGLAQVDLGRAMVYMKEKKFDQALKLMESSAEVAKKTNAWSLGFECFKNLAALHEQKGDYKKALDYYKQFKSLEDSLFSQGMQAKLLQDQIRFETASKEDQIKALTKLEEMRKDEIKKQSLIRNILAVTMALTIFLLINVYRSGQRRVRINKLLMEHQDEIKKRSIELEQLNEVKDKFFSIISHDLRSPMNALSAILDLMDQDRIKPEEFSRLNKELRKQFTHTKSLINNLLDWALLQMDKLKTQPEKFDLRTVVDDNFKMLASLHLKEIIMLNKVAPGTFGWGDLNIVNLVLRNLILNGLKFTESGGTIEVASREEGNDLVISIKDSGIGISPEVQALLFEKTSGYTTRGTANEKGTGLGLILSKEFVEKNGGRIWLESEVGKGSTFFFTIRKG
ncbi:MAG: tetratricopeptide repeat-containing sensor histidine kinase [Bacteroidetes bacterium]|nr:tetratricopeptide repeat-containing sensor histidine kinase [Bacteroidota bacterium]